MENSQFTLEFEKPLRDLEKQLDELKRKSMAQNLDLSSEIEAIEKKIDVTKREIYSNLTSWQIIQLARHPKRPYALDYINTIFTDFQEFHGDRRFGDDKALIGGAAFFKGKAIMIIAQQKGRDTKENLERNFGMPLPEGYRKALRLMKMAEKFNMPIISLIDTKAAYAGIGSEERHVAEAIAVNLREMSLLKVPFISVVIGEGSSGGALGIGVTDRILVLQYAYYSICPPEACAAILWRNRDQSVKAAESLKLNAKELVKLGIADEIIEEPYGGAHCDHQAAAKIICTAIGRHLKELQGKSADKLIEERYQKYRAIGEFEESFSTQKTQRKEA